MPLTTRWNDNDPYGHLNNVAYYAFFDAAVNAILVEAGLLDPASSPVIGIVAESRCRFHSALSFPDAIEVGLAVDHLGRSSVRYRLAAFKAGAAQASADGRLHPCLRRARDRPADADSGGAPAADGDDDAALSARRRAGAAHAIFTRER